jgi:hypothetical protein
VTGDGGINARVSRLTAVTRAAGGNSSCSVKPGVPPAFKPTCAAAVDNKTACDALNLTCRWASTSADIVEWATTWVTGGPNRSMAWDEYGNFSSPHSVAYDECWDAVFVADRNHQRVVQLQGRLGTEYTPNWDLRCLLGYHYDNISDPSSYAVWSLRAVQTMSKDHVGKLFVGIVRTAASFSSIARVCRCVPALGQASNPPRPCLRWTLPPLRRHQAQG